MLSVKSLPGISRRSAPLLQYGDLPFLAPQIPERGVLGSSALDDHSLVNIHEIDIDIGVSCEDVQLYPCRIRNSYEL